MSYILVGGRLLVASVFLLSLWGKARNRTLFRQFVTATAHLLGVDVGAARGLAAATIVAETAIVAMTLIPVAPVTGFLLATVLLACFTAALVRARRRVSRVTCHCFGASDVPVARRHVIRNLVLIAVVALLVAATIAVPPGPTQSAGIAVAALVAFPSALAVAHLDDIVDVMRPIARK